MGGINDDGDDVLTYPSLLCKSLQKAQTELRQEYDVREESRRELEFLEKGGDPLDFNCRNDAPVSVQSTSPTDQLSEHFVTSEANTADNLMLFESKSQLHKNGIQIVKKFGNTADFGITRQAYTRRNRSRPNRDVARSISTVELVSSQKRFLNNSEKQKDCKLSSKLNRNVPEAPVNTASVELDCVGQKEQVNNKVTSGKNNGFRSSKRDKRNTSNVLDSDSSCTQIGVSLDEKPGSGNCTTSKIINSDANTDVDKSDKENKKPHEKVTCAVTLNEELKKSEPNIKNEIDDSSTVGGIDQETERTASNLLTTNIGGNVCSNEDFFESKVSIKVSTVDPVQQNSSGNNLDDRAHQDSILEEARVIETKHQRISELSFGILWRENRPKSHWDFVLEEVVWLANDFAQERIWKITAAAQICHHVSFSSRLRIQEQNVRWKTKEVAHTLAKAVMEFWSSLQGTNKDFKLRCPERKGQHAVESYAMRFLEYNNSSSNIQNSAPEAPLTPDKVYDFGVLDMSWEEDHLTKENLYYKIPSGATEVYRESIESYLLNLEKFGNSNMQEEGTSGFNDVTESGSQENVFEDQEGETSSYYLPGAFEGSKSSKFAKKQQQNFPFGQIAENIVNSQPSIRIGKRSGNSLNVSFHTKRMRTASRPKVLNQPSGGTRIINHADASSGDNDSFQDEQTTFPSNLEVNSVGDFEKKLTYDSYEVSEKPKKKKKAKHLNSTYEQRLRDSNFHIEQKDHPKRKSEKNHFPSNGNSGLFGQHISKKPKVMRQSLDDNSFENLGMASQMSNMPNPNKIIKLINGRDRLRKIKQSKMLSGQSDSENSWSQYEDQALVVLVHDMGPNWEFVSDALSSSLRFKRIFHDSKKCKDRHYFLMDRTGTDGADSAEDSGSSQPYPSTLPGIPKGSARQLFQRLHGPMEEDTLKSHFEKIIRITKKCRPHNENLEVKQVQHPHASHTFALSQASPNNLSGGPVLTPLDLCDVSESSLDTLSIGFQNPPSGTDTVAPALPTPDANLSVQNASTAPPAPPATTNPSTQSNPLNSPARFGTARSTPFDEQQRMQQLNNQSLPHSPGFSGPVRILPGGLNRSVPLTKPAFQGLNSQSMLSLPPGQGISMSRPRSHPLHKLRPIQNPELQKQQIQQGNNNPLNGLNTSFTNQTTPPVQPYPALRPLTLQRPHLLNNPHIQRPISMQNQAYGVRFAKERQQQQQRLMQLSVSNGTVPPVQQSQPRPQTQNSSTPVPFSPPQKHLMLPARNPQGGGTVLPVAKQRQQFSTASRQHPQQKTMSDSSQLPPHHIKKQHHLKSYQENPTAQRPIKDPPLANSVGHGQSTGNLTEMQIMQPEKLCVGSASPTIE